MYRGATWTTDAPFRETPSAIAHCRDLGLMGVEMEAAALYAFAEAKRNAVVCLAHVTNRMARSGVDFEKPFMFDQAEGKDLRNEADRKR